VGPRLDVEPPQAGQQKLLKGKLQRPKIFVLLRGQDKKQELELQNTPSGALRKDRFSFHGWRSLQDRPEETIRG